MDRATLDLKVATFEAFAQSRCTKVVIYETDDSVARYNGRSFFRRTDYCNVSAHHYLQGNLTEYSLVTACVNLDFFLSGRRVSGGSMLRLANHSSRCLSCPDC